MSSETTSLAVREISPTVWQTVQAIAPDAKASGLFGVPNQAAAAMVMLKGYELGLGLAASFEFISVIDGKPSLSPKGALALVLGSPHCAGIDIKPVDNPIGCQVTAKRKNGMTYTATFTVDDAKRAGLVRSGGAWEKYPRQMAQWRAVGYALDVVFPDVLGGLRRADDYGADITPSGEVIDVGWSTVETPAAPPVPNGSQPPQNDVGVRLSALAETYGAEAVLRANGGRIPATTDEIEAVAMALANEAVNAA